MSNISGRIFFFVLSLAFLTGCAGIHHQHGQEDSTHQAMKMAEQALEKANDAYNLAQLASENASEAHYNSNQAQEAAESAMACCNDNSQRLENMFEDAMRK